MAEETLKQRVYSTSGINIVAGLWLIIAPFVLGYAAIQAAVWNDIVIGIAVAIMAVVRVTQPARYEGLSWVNFVLGIWLVLAPFIMGYARVQSAVWNDILLGLIVLALAATSAMTTRRMHPHHPGPAH